MVEIDPRKPYIPLTKDEAIAKHLVTVLSQTHLAPQSLEGLDVSTLTPVSP